MTIKNIAVYAGTFDPITFGHIDLLQRASNLFERIFVAIAESQHKKPLFSLPERIALANQALASFKNVEVHGFDSLLLDFVKAHHANVILRGLRSVTDFDYELQLASMNRQLNSDIESVFLMPAENYMYISASLVREIAALGGDITAFVPPLVAKALQKKFNR